MGTMTTEECSGPPPGLCPRPWGLPGLPTFCRSVSMIKLSPCSLAQRLWDVVPKGGTRRICKPWSLLGSPEMGCVQVVPRRRKQTLSGEQHQRTPQRTGLVEGTVQVCGGAGVRGAGMRGKAEDGGVRRQGSQEEEEKREGRWVYVGKRGWIVAEKRAPIHHTPGHLMADRQGTLATSSAFQSTSLFQV